MTKSSPPSWLPYVLPLALFYIVSSVCSAVHLSYICSYPLSILAPAIAIFAFKRRGDYPELTISPKSIPLTLIGGIVLCALWVLVDRVTPHFAFLGSRTAYNPWQHIPNLTTCDLFIAIRFLGLVAIAPIMEELFYRSFLLRFIIDPDKFKSIEIGKPDTMACIAVVILMAVAHPEWLAAALFSLTMNLLIYKTKSLGNCILVHGFTNLALGIYVIATGSWAYW